MSAFTQGARLPAWPYLMDIMNTHGLNVIVGPSVFEAPPYTTWCTSAENFEWGSDQQPLVLLNWIPVEMRLSLLDRALHCGTFVVVGRRSIMDEDVLDWLSRMHSDLANIEGQRFAYKLQWWRMGNKALGACDPITIRTLKPDLTLPLQDHSLDPPIPLTIPDSEDAR
eukprot:1837679-Rhodomonas_salina.1